MRARLSLASLLLLSCGDPRVEKAEKQAFDTIQDALDGYVGCVVPDAPPEELFTSVAGRCFAARPALGARIDECRDGLRNGILKATEDARFAGRVKIGAGVEAYAKGPLAPAALKPEATCPEVAKLVCEEAKTWLADLVKARGSSGRIALASLACTGKSVKGIAEWLEIAKVQGDVVSVTDEGAWKEVGKVPAGEKAAGAAGFDGGAWLVTWRTPKEEDKDGKKKDKAKKKDEPEPIEPAPVEIVVTRLGGAGGEPLVAETKPKALSVTLDAVRGAKESALLVGVIDGAFAVVRVQSGRVTIDMPDLPAGAGAVRACRDGDAAAALVGRHLFRSGDGGTTWRSGPTLTFALEAKLLVCRGKETVLFGSFGEDRLVATTCDEAQCSGTIDLPAWKDVVGYGVHEKGLAVLRKDALFVGDLPQPGKPPIRFRPRLLASSVELPAKASAIRVDGAFVPLASLVGLGGQP